MASSIGYVLLAAFCSVLFAGCFASPALQGRILEGEDATIENYPYLVSVRLDDSHICGGSIIAEQFILTAAHCVAELQATPYDISRITVRVGTINLFAGGSVKKVSLIKIHESYGSFLNDVAVLKLEAPLSWTTKIQSIPMAESSDVVAAGDEVVIGGWGRATTDGAYSYRLKTDSAKAVSTDDCEDSIGYGYPSTLCLQSEPGQGSCNGDAGGPAVYNKQLVGVSNFVIGACGTKYPDVFARVSYFKSWVDAVISSA